MGATELMKIIFRRDRFANGTARKYRELNIVEYTKRQGAYIVVTFAANGSFIVTPTYRYWTLRNRVFGYIC